MFPILNTKCQFSNTHIFIGVSFVLKTLLLASFLCSLFFIFFLSFARLPIILFLELFMESIPGSKYFDEIKIKWRKKLTTFGSEQDPVLMSSHYSILPFKYFWIVFLNFVNHFNISVVRLKIAFHLTTACSNHFYSIIFNILASNSNWTGARPIRI